MINFLVALIFGALTTLVGICFILSVINMVNDKRDVKYRLVDTLVSLVLVVYIVVLVYCGLKFGG